MHAHGDAIAVEAAQVGIADFDAAFLAHYGRVARVVGRVVRDRGRAEEIAVDVFLNWRRHQEAQGEHAIGWLYRTAVRMGLDELRRQARRTRFERLFGAVRAVPPTPEDLHTARDEQQRVRTVLAGMRRRDASLLLLRGDGQNYEAVAAALGLKSTSVGTLISRAQRAFRTEYERRYGSH
jgi:RNA polymerase sigma-70 factor (ECF subfamily)